MMASEHLLPLLMPKSFLDLVYTITIIAFTVGLWPYLRASRPVPKTIDWATERIEIFPKTRAWIREVYKGLKCLDIGYQQFSRIDLPFVMPNAGFGPVVILPQSQIPWLISQPDHTLSAIIPQGDRIAINYLMPRLDFNHTMFQFDIKKALTPNLSKLQGDIAMDLHQDINSALGMQLEWHGVNLFGAMQQLLFKSLNKASVGEPLCHDEGYLSSLSLLIKVLGGSGLLVGQLTPPLLKPIFGYTLALPIYILKRRVLRYLLPVVRKRLIQMQRRRDNPGYVSEESQDMMNWMIAAVLDGKDKKARDPESLALHILFFSLAGIFPTILTSTNTFLNLLTHPSNPLLTLHTEAASIFTSPSAWSSPTSLTNLHLTDSAIRETLRLRPLLARGLVREVIQQNGIKTPDGTLLPKGCWVGTAVRSVMRDERFYQNANEFEPFRFATGHTEDGSENLKRQSLVTASDTYLPWGYGRHACPGRHFVSQQLKLLIAYITLKYEIQPLETPLPPSLVLGDTITPPRGVEIVIRRRTGMEA